MCARFLSQIAYNPSEKNNQFDNFTQQAKLRRISVITGEQLPEVSALLQQEIKATGRSH